MYIYIYSTKNRSLFNNLGYKNDSILVEFVEYNHSINNVNGPPANSWNCLQLVAIKDLLGIPPATHLELR